MAAPSSLVPSSLFSRHRQTQHSPRHLSPARQTKERTVPSKVKVAIFSCLWVSLYGAVHCSDEKSVQLSVCCALEIFRARVSSQLMNDVAQISLLRLVRENCRQGRCVQCPGERLRKWQFCIFSELKPQPSQSAFSLLSIICLAGLAGKFFRNITNNFSFYHPIATSLTKTILIQIRTRATASALVSLVSLRLFSRQ